MVFECDAGGAGDGQGEPVDPPGLVMAAVLVQPGPGEAFDAVEFLAVDGTERAAVPLGTAGLDLAEDHRVALAGNEVDLAAPMAPVAGEDLHPVPLEVGGGEQFADPSELVRAEPSQVHGCPRSNAMGPAPIEPAGAARPGLRRGLGRPFAAPAVHGAASARPGRGSSRTWPCPNRSSGSR